MCLCESIEAPSMLRLIRKVVALARMLPTLDLSWEKEAARGKRNKSWFCCACSTPEASKKRFPMILPKQNSYKFTVKTARGGSHSRHESNRGKV